MDPTPSSWPVLRFLNEDAGIHQTLNRLPHWQQNQSAYFLTFRLADSLPSHIFEQWRQERDLWCLKHPAPWSPESESEYHRLFSAAIDKHLDQGHGTCLLRQPVHSTIVAESFRHFDHGRYLLHAWVIMPNHVHLLLSLADNSSLEKIVGSWKRFTAREIGRQNHGAGTVWQKDYFDRLIRDWDHFMNAARYIRRNPEKAKLPAGSFTHYESPWVGRLLA